MNYKLSLFIVTCLLFLDPARAISPIDKNRDENRDENRDVIQLKSQGGPIRLDFFFDKSGQPQGGVVITYFHQSIPSNLLNTAVILSNHGWSTALIRLHDQEAEDGLRLRETITFMQEEKGQYNLALISHHRTWDSALDFLSAQIEEKPSFRALILLDIIGSTHLNTLRHNLPILDINTSRQPQPAFNQRRVAASRFKLNAYDQINLPYRGLPNDNRENRLSKRLRGWLATNISGMEIDK